MAKKVGPRLRELVPAARASQDDGSHNLYVETAFLTILVYIKYELNRYYLSQVVPNRKCEKNFGGPTCDALAIGVGVVSIDVEAVAHPAVGRQPRAESEHGEELKH